MAEEKVIVGYWDCRGLVHPIILILEYLEKPYEFQTPSKDLIGPPPKYDKELWYKAKDALLEGILKSVRVRKVGAQERSVF